MPQPQIQIPQQALGAFCQKHHIAQLSLYGSVLTSSFNADSDIDVLVEFEPGHTPTYLQLARMEKELSTIFQGRTVDLRTPNELSRFFRQEVLNSALVQYAAS